MAASAAVETLTFSAEADTHVDWDTPTSEYGSSKAMHADGSSQKQSFIRFRLSGLTDQPVTSVRLRLHEVDSSAIGGRVFSMSGTTWSESISWSTRPAPPSLREHARRVRTA